MKIENSEKSNYFLPLLIFIVSAIYYLSYFNVGINLSDQGYFTNVTIRILNGQVPYRDFIYYPPGANYIVALLFNWLGTNLLIERVFWVSVVSGTVLLTFLLARKLMPFPYSAVPPVLALLVPGPWHKALIPFFYLLTALLSSKYINHKSFKWAFICGFIAGFTIYFRYDVAGFISIGLMLLFFSMNFIGYERTVKKWLWESASFLAGLLLAIAPGVFFFAFSKSGRDAFVYLLYLTFKQQGGGSMAYPFPVLSLGLLHRDFWGFFESALFYISPVVIGFVFILFISHWIRGRIEKKDFFLLLLALLGMAAYNQTLIRAEWAHLLQSTHIIYLLLPYLIWTIHCSLSGMKSVALKKILKGSSFLVFTCFAISFIFFFINKKDIYSGTIGVLGQKEARLNISRAGVFIRKQEAGEIEGMIAYVDKMTNAREPILVIPYAPMIYYLADRKNATYFDAIFPGTFEDEAMEDSFINDIKKNKIRLIVYQDIAFTDKESSRLKNYARPLYDYVMQNYKPAAQFGDYQIFLRN